MTNHPYNCTDYTAPIDDVGPATPRPPKAPDKAEALLHEALKVVTGARRQAYGTPENNFGCIADLWNTYLRRRQITPADMAAEVTPGDVAVMMVLMKAARLAESPAHHDSAVDIAGYAACLARCQNDAP